MAAIIYHNDEPEGYQYGNGRLISSRFEEEEIVGIKFDFQPLIKGCRVEAVSMVDGKVLYDVGIPTYGDLSNKTQFWYERINGIHSPFLRKNGEILDIDKMKNDGDDLGTGIAKSILGVFAKILLVALALSTTLGLLLR